MVPYRKRISMLGFCEVFGDIFLSGLPLWLLIIFSNKMYFLWKAVLLLLLNDAQGPACTVEAICSKFYVLLIATTTNQEYFYHRANRNYCVFFTFTIIISLFFSSRVVEISKGKFVCRNTSTSIFSIGAVRQMLPVKFALPQPLCRTYVF